MSILREQDHHTELFEKVEETQFMHTDHLQCLVEGLELHSTALSRIIGAVDHQEPTVDTNDLWGGWPNAAQYNQPIGEASGSGIVEEEDVQSERSSLSYADDEPVQLTEGRRVFMRAIEGIIDQAAEDQKVHEFPEGREVFIRKLQDMIAEEDNQSQLGGSDKENEEPLPVVPHWHQPTPSEDEWIYRPAPFGETFPIAGVTTDSEQEFLTSHETGPSSGPPSPEPSHIVAAATARRDQHALNYYRMLNDVNRWAFGPIGTRENPIDVSLDSDQETRVDSDRESSAEPMQPSGTRVITNPVITIPSIRFHYTFRRSNLRRNTITRSDTPNPFR